MSGKTLTVRLDESDTENWDSLAGKTDNRSEVIRQFIRLADSERMQAIQDDLGADDPADVLKQLMDGYALPNEGNPFSDYDPETFVGEFETGDLMKLKEIDEEVALDPDHIEGMPKNIEDRVETLIAILRYRHNSSVTEGDIYNVVTEFIGDSNHILETVDYPQKIMDELPQNFLRQERYFVDTEKFAEFANSNVEKFRGMVDDAMGQMRESKENSSFGVRVSSNEEAVDEIVQVSLSLEEAAADYPELIDIDAGEVERLRTAVVEYYNSKGETDLLAGDEIDDDDVEGSEGSEVDDELDEIMSADPVQ